MITFLDTSKKKSTVEMRISDGRAICDFCHSWIFAGRKMEHRTLTKISKDGCRTIETWNTCLTCCVELSPLTAFYTPPPDAVS